MREILTLQLGQSSNYTATHFWNTQESYFSYDENEDVPINHDVYWRQGLGADGSETFLPRTVIYDLKGGFGSLRKINALYEPEQTEDPATLWSGRTVVQKQDQIEQSAYQQALDTGSSAQAVTKSSVRYWSDFSRVFYHPRSLNQLYDYELDSTIRPFDRFAAGADLFSTLNKDEDILDRDFRPFVEECDHMQGIQVFTGIDDAWGGFASEYLEGLRDEYPKTCVWAWGIQAPIQGVPRQQRQLRLGNVAQSLNRLCSTASMVIPLAMPPSGLPSGVKNLDASSPWHVSALMSAAIETATLPLRLKHRLDGQRPASLDELTELINTNGQQTLARLQLGLGNKADTSEDADTLQDGVDLFGFDDRSSGKARGGVRKFGQISSNRGSDAAEEEPEAGEHDETKRPIPGQSIIRKYTSPLSYPMPDSYPLIYRDATQNTPVDMQTVLSTDTSMRASLRQLRLQTAWVLPSEEREALTNGLDELADAYQDDWSSGSDDDDDDD